MSNILGFWEVWCQRKERRALVRDLHSILLDVYSDHHSNTDTPSDYADVKKYRDDRIYIFQRVSVWGVNGERCSAEELEVNLGQTHVLYFKVSDDGSIVSEIERPGKWRQYVSQLADEARVKQAEQQRTKAFEAHARYVRNHMPVDDSNLF